MKILLILLVSNLLVAKDLYVCLSKKIDDTASIYIEGKYIKELKDFNNSKYILVNGVLYKVVYDTPNIFCIYIIPQ